MSTAPTWYQTSRSALLLLQSVLGLMIFSFSLNRRNCFLLRLLTGNIVGMAAMFFIGKNLYIPGSTGTAVLSHAAVSLICYIFLILLSIVCFEESLWTILFTASSGYIAQDLAGSFKTVFRQITVIGKLSEMKFGIITVDVICYGFVYLLLFFLFRPFVKNREDNFDNKIKAVFSVLILLVCVGMARLTQDNLSRNQLSVLAESMYQILIDGFILALQFGVMERAKLNQHVEVMRELVHQQRAQYEASKESAQLINEKYHDLKHLLKSFRGTVPQEQLDKLKASIAAYERPANSGNEVLDVLLAEKMGICNQRNIVLTCSLGQTDFSFIEELDLYSLFQNMLTNAINAVSVLPEDSERFIVLSASRDGNMLTIHMENPCEEQIVFKEGLPVTKDDPSYHGFGMKSMVRTAEKYGGMLTAEQRGNLFLLDILLLAEEE